MARLINQVTGAQTTIDQNVSISQFLAIRYGEDWEDQFINFMRRRLSDGQIVHLTAGQAAEIAIVFCLYKEGKI